MAMMAAMPAMIPAPAMRGLDRTDVRDRAAHPRGWTERGCFGAIKRQRSDTKDRGCRGRNNGKLVHRRLLGLPSRERRFSSASFNVPPFTLPPPPGPKTQAFN